MNYPGGIRPRNNLASSPVASHVKKSASKKKRTLKVAAGNRGMDFEAEINASNDYYRKKGLCLITKRPTPINVVKVDYTHGPKIIQAYFESQSTTDYNGVYQGHYIDFEAKSTRNKTSFPLANIPPQQIAHLKGVISQNGIAFFLINWALLNETYLVKASDVIEFYESRPRASIPYSAMKEKAFLVKEGYLPRFDYLPVLVEAFLK